jgi:hypothetical protein
MSDKLQKLADKRQLLIAQAASQRLLLAQDSHSLHRPMAMVDKAVAALCYIKQHPIYIAGGGAALLSLTKLSGIGKWYRRGWLGWQILNKLRSK